MTLAHLSTHLAKALSVAKALSALGSAALLAGCVSTTPVMDSKFGDAVRQARTAQTLNPDDKNFSAVTADWGSELVPFTAERAHTVTSISLRLVDWSVIFHMRT